MGEKTHPLLGEQVIILTEYMFYDSEKMLKCQAFYMNYADSLSTALHEANARDWDAGTALKVVSYNGVVTRH